MPGRSLRIYIYALFAWQRRARAHCVRLCPVTLAAYIYSGRLSAGRSYPPVLVSVPWGSPGIHGAPGALFNDYTMGGLSTYRSSI